ncbi:OmpA family protein [Maricaulis sp. MIT060901]|uniref:OmpA family protein n=1 Tax=Maricaulis sp. MIT060901 TaxID=3096993 RepID=UPI00399A9297
MIKLSVLSACVAFLFITTTSWAQREVGGHPLVMLYEGAELRSGEQFEFDTYRLVTGFDFDKREATGITIEGRLNRLYHDNPDERSEYEIFANYLEAFEDAGLTIIFQCAGDGECFTGSTRNAYRNFNGFAAINGGSSRYAAGTLEHEGRLAYIAFGTGRHGTSIDIIETAEMATGMVTVSAEVLASGLEADGHVRVDGLLFALDEPDLLPGSEEALQAVADLLQQNPEMSLYVVGHTDSSGALAHNMSLSQRRAGSVVTALVEQYGIDAARLEAHGVGPLSPEASQASDAGRALNRRVEIVLK